MVFYQRHFAQLSLLAAVLVSGSIQAHGQNYPPMEIRNFNITTQGPPWPPSTLVDKSGNFVVVGTVITQDAAGGIKTVPNGAALVSKDTVPPLNAQGKEDFSNPFAAPYTIIRNLDLSRGSRDRKIELFTPSFGPFTGSWGGGPRIPMEGASKYNLNMIPTPCPEIFPSESQKTSFTRPSFPLQQYPILGFQGDDLEYDVDSGEPYDPMTASGPGCEMGCPGETDVDFRSDKPITLGDWLSAKGKFGVRLSDYSKRAGGYKSAVFKLQFERLLPHSVYTAWAVKQRVFSQGRFPGPLGVPSIFVTDKFGNAELEVKLPNPFPARDLDDEGLRLIGIEISYHPDAQNWGACGERFGVGYRVFNWFDMKPDGSRDFDTLVTVP